MVYFRLDYKGIKSAPRGYKIGPAEIEPSAKATNRRKMTVHTRKPTTWDSTHDPIFYICFCFIFILFEFWLKQNKTLFKCTFRFKVH